MTIFAESVDLVIGVDTHKHTNTAAAVLVATGAVLENQSVPSTPSGHEALFQMAVDHGKARAWAIEGTNSYGAGLTRFLCERGERVIELERPVRPKRPGGKKSDPLDAVRAAREALSRLEVGEPRAIGDRTALSVLLTARRSAVVTRTATKNQFLALVVAAPESLRERFRAQSTDRSIAIASRLRVDPRHDTERRTMTAVLRSLALRVRELDAEAQSYEKAITVIVREWRPELLSQRGIGPIVAATVLCAWSHSGRFRSEAAFASLAGVSPIPASSGMTVRHRLNRRGDRQLNSALHTIVINRIRGDQATQDYVERRHAEGKTAREIKRCLKRYVARQIFRELERLK